MESAETVTVDTIDTIDVSSGSKDKIYDIIFNPLPVVAHLEERKDDSVELAMRVLSKNYGMDQNGSETCKLKSENCDVTDENCEVKDESCGVEDENCEVGEETCKVIDENQEIQKALEIVTQEDDHTRILQRIEQRRLYAEEQDIKLQKITFVLLQEGYTQEGINELFGSVLNNNQDLADDIANRAVELGWKGKSRIGNSPPRIRNRGLCEGGEKVSSVVNLNKVSDSANLNKVSESANLNKVSDSANLNKTPDLVNKTPEQPEELVLPPKKMFIPSMDFIKNAFSMTEEDKERQEQQNKLLQEQQNTENKQQTKLPEQNTENNHVVTPSIHELKNSAASQCNILPQNKVLFNAIKHLNKSDIKLNMNYDASLILSALRESEPQQRKKVIMFLSKTYGSHFVEHLLYTALD